MYSVRVMNSVTVDRANTDDIFARNVKLPNKH